MTEVAREEEESLWVLGLQPACNSVEDVSCSFRGSRGGNIHRYHHDM